MVSIVANGFGTEINIERSVEGQSLVVAYGLGVLLTLLVVTVSAWRVSVLNIVTAVRNLPDPMTVHKGKRRWLKAAVSIAFGALFIMSGASADVAMPFMLGVSLVVIGIALAARAAGVPDRLALTIGGLLLVGWWLLPFGVIDAMLDEPKMDFSIWIVSGIMLVVGATWVVMYNADALLGAAVAAGGRVRRLAPVLKMALAYPLRSRFRTGVSLAMFTLVVFTLVCGSAISNSYLTAADDIERFGGGFDLRAGTPSVSPIGDIEGAIASEPSLSAADYTAVGSEALVPLEARQADTKNGFESYPVRGADATYLQTTTYRMAATARGYDDAQAVWHAVAETPGLAVVDSWVVPHRDNFGFAVLPDFQLSGFYVEDGTFEPIDVVLRDPNTRTTVTLTVIGVLDDGAPFEQAGITTAMEVLKPFGPRVQPTMYYAQLADGVDSDNAAKQLEAAFFDQGMEAESMQSLLDAAVGESLTFQYLILGFMGLGLVVGVAALGVIGARAVVERRQHIGVLRAIGFQPAMVRMTFLIEASFIALTAITIGTVLGLILGYNVIDDSRNTASWSDMEFVVPWAQFFVVFVVVYLAVLITTFSPAVRASKVYPAEALRYE
jgi:putative ABC transport system permease protein